MISNNKLVKIFVSLVLFPFLLGSLYTYLSDHNIFELSFVSKTSFAFIMYLVAFIGSIYLFRLKKEEKYKYWWNLVSVLGIIIFGLMAYLVTEFSRFGF